MATRSGQFFATGVANASGRATALRLAAHLLGQHHAAADDHHGQSGREGHEAFGEDYELPNDGYYESCAACGLADFAQRMFLLERAEGADILERVLYNAILRHFAQRHERYCSPLSVGITSATIAGVLPPTSRALLQIGHYAYAASDQDLYVNICRGTVRILFHPASRCASKRTIPRAVAWECASRRPRPSPSPCVSANRLV
jgi:DUF1680 family protein